MKNTHRKIFVGAIVIIGLLLINSIDVLAQCAMCKATVETNVNESGGGFASQLNFGILYLFAAPYVLAMVIGYSWYRKSRAHKRELEQAEMRKHRIAQI